MATWTKTNLANAVMEHIGIKPAGQAASAEDLSTTRGVIDGVFDELRGDGLVPFLISAIPTWAQQPMVMIIAPDVAPKFGIAGARLQQHVGAYQVGIRRLAKGGAGRKHEMPVKVDYF